MPRLAISGFDGLAPRTSPTMLGESNAQVADNVKLYAGELRYWRGPLLDSTTAVGGVQTLYRLKGASANRWLTWTTDVNVVPGPLADTSDYRVYYTDGVKPKKTNWALASTGSGPWPAAYYYMGVPAPVAAPGVANSGGSGTAETRTYVYTTVCQFGAVTEESAPSPASALVNALPGGTVTVNGFDATLGAGYNQISRRIYRAVAGSTTTSYEFVAEISAATTSYADTLATAALGENLSTLGHLPPPDTLQGLVALPCGALAGFVDNTVYFSEVYLPHAWPLAYALSVPYPVVGLGVYGTSVVVMTTRNPYIIAGSAPGAMSVELIPLPEPCVAKRSIVQDAYGVTYASPNGLVNISDQIREVITKALFERDEWQAIGPQNISATIIGGRYVATFATGAQAMLISRDSAPALSFMDLKPGALFADFSNAALYYSDAASTAIYQLDADTATALTYQWKSKRFVLPQSTTFSALRLDADYSQVTPSDHDAVIAANQALITAGTTKGSINSVAINTYALNGSALQSVPAIGGFVQALIYGDGVLQASLSLTDYGVHRLPAFRSRDIEVALVGNINVRSVVLATTAQELIGGQ